MAASASNPTGSPGNGVYWIGSDGNVYAKAAGFNGVQNWGAPTADNPMIDVINGLQQISDPNPPAPASNSTGGTGSGSVTTDPNAVAYYTDVINQLQSQLGSAQAQQPTLIANIENAANQQQTELNQQEGTAESGYAGQRASNGQNRAQNVSSIDQNANSTYQSLLSLLGAAGAGVSSAANFNAPEAVSKNASAQRSGADTTYNSNESAIDTADTQTKQQYQNALTDLLSQENSAKGNALTSLLNSEAQLEQQIGSAQINRAEYGGQSYQQAEASDNTKGAIGSIESQLNDIFKQYATPSFSVQPVSVTTPNLTSFSTDPITIASQSSNPSTDSSFLPYLSSLKNNNQTTSPTGILLGNQQQQQQAPVVAGATA